MRKVLVLIILLLVTANIGHTKAPKPPVTQCRTVVLFSDHVTTYGTDWVSCEKAEAVFNDLLDELTGQGSVVWVDQRIKVGKDQWSFPKTYIEPVMIPLDFTVDWVKT